MFRQAYKELYLHPCSQSGKGAVMAVSTTDLKHRPYGTMQLSKDNRQHSSFLAVAK